MYWKRSALVTLTLFVVSSATNLLVNLLINALRDQLPALADSFNTSISGLVALIYQANSIVSIGVTFLVIWWFLRYFAGQQEKPKRIWLAQTEESTESQVGWSAQDPVPESSVEPEEIVKRGQSSFR